MSVLTTTRPRREVPPGAAGSVRWLVVPLIGLSVVLGAAAGYLASGNLPILALLFPVALLPVVLWRNPRVGVYLLLLAAVTVEQFEYKVGPRDGAVTARIPAFEGVLPAGVNPVEVLLLMTVVVVVMRAVQRREPWLHRSPVLAMMLAMLGLVLGYLVIGLSRGGDLTMGLWEVRPYVYLVLVYLVASALITDMKSVQPLLWIIVLGSGAKAIYGFTIFWDVRDLEPRPEAVLGHEDSFFFGMYIILTAALWMYGIRGRIKVVATMLLPIVLLADMVNSRRTAWLILIVGIGILGAVAFAKLPHRRRMIGTLAVLAALVTAIYLPAFWNQNGTLAQPARAVRSAVAPDARDENSNIYREIETFNIKVYIAQSRSLGLGYGVKIEYFGLVDLTKDAPLLAYVPHNGVLYQWLRLGLLGLVIFSIFLSQAMISAIRLSGERQREIAMIGGVTAAVLGGYVAMGVTDMGFFWFRNAIAMATLLGVVDGLARMQRTRALEADRTRGTPALRDAGAASGSDGPAR